MKFSAMHITNNKLSLDKFTVGILLNIFMEHDLYLICNVDPYSVLLAIATNIPVQLKTGFVVQGHTWRPQSNLRKSLHNYWTYKGHT